MRSQARFEPTFTEDQESTEEQQRLRRLATQARDFIISFGALLRQLRMHAADNRAVLNQLEATRHVIEVLRQEEDVITVVFAEGHTFVNGVWVRATRLMWEHSTFITELMEKLGARGAVFGARFDVNTISDFAVSLLQGPTGPLKPGEVPDVKILGIRLIPSSTEELTHQGRGDFRAKARNVIREGLLVLDRRSTPKLDLSMRRRQSSLVQNLIRIAEESTEDLLALTTIRDPMLPEATHALNVTIFSIAIGKLMGLRRRDLMRLGATALNHNIGDTLIDRDIIKQPRELEAQERRIVESHPLLGMFHILHTYGFKAGMVARAVVCAEHHLTWDGKGGYPFPVQMQPHPFSRIIAISDTFNALISARSHREAFPPDQALKLTIRSADTQLDPVLVRVLMGLVGRYPAGTVVELDTGEWGVVVGPGRGATPLKRPRVIIVNDEDGFEIDEFKLVDLGERHMRRRAWLRTIVRTQDPKQLVMTVSAYLLADRTEVQPGKLDIDEFKERKAQQARRKGLQPS